MEFAALHMQGKGWVQGEGLGKYGQGITDAIKPKLKFDQAGIGHNKAEEYEFQWWDHVFNKAAKTVTVEEGADGEVQVDFNSSKSELSTKKLRKKAEKAMKAEVKAKLYSNFVKSGTLTGGKMEEDGEAENDYVEDKDLSKIRTLTDEELVKACGGRTAHKGGRHGLKMNAKLARIEEAEREYMENMRKHENMENIKKHNLAPDAVPGGDGDSEAVTKKKKKKKRKKEELEEIETTAVEVLKEKKSKNKNLETHENVENFEPSEIKEIKSKKRRKEKCVEDEMVDSLVCDIRYKKSKKSKKDRLNDSDNADSTKTDEDKGVKRSKEESVVDFSDSLQCDRHPKKKKKKKLKGGSD